MPRAADVPNELPAPSPPAPMKDRIHLLACHGCRRQLDVSALEIGDEVMCVCDTVLVVGPPKIVNVRGLSCGRCGGAVEEGSTGCVYCRAELSANDLVESSLCPACATRIPNDSRHCKACGVALRAAALPPLPVGGKCPRCDGKLRVHLSEDAEFVECTGGGAAGEGCGGLWCTRDTFERLRHFAATPGGTMAHAVPAGPPPPREPVGPNNGRAYVACLTCGELMQRRQFRHADRPSGVVLDVCKDHGVWFDRDELQATLAFVRGLRDGGMGFAPARSTATLERRAQGTPATAETAPRRGHWLGEALDDAIHAVTAVFGFSLFD